MSKVIASYAYHNVQGDSLARIDRIEPGWHGRSKEFLPYLDGKGGYVDRPGLNGVKLPLYHADEVCAAINAGETIYVTEGEGKCDALRAVLRRSGSAAAVTTIQGGAIAPMRPEHTSSLAGITHAVVLADSDDPGRRAARSRGQRIADEHRSCEVRIIDLYPDRDDGSDVADWLAEDHSLKELGSLLNAAAKVERSPVAFSATARAGTQSRGSEERNSRALDLVRLSEVLPESVEWLWRARIPRSKVTLLVGDPGGGKSFASLAIASGVTHNARSRTMAIRRLDRRSCFGMARMASKIRSGFVRSRWVSPSRGCMSSANDRRRGPS